MLNHKEPRMKFVSSPISDSKAKRFGKWPQLPRPWDFIGAFGFLTAGPFFSVIPGTWTGCVRSVGGND